MYIYIYILHTNIHMCVDGNLYIHVCLMYAVQYITVLLYVCTLSHYIAQMVCMQMFEVIEYVYMCVCVCVCVCVCACGYL